MSHYTTLHKASKCTELLLVPELPNTVHGCRQVGVVTVRLILE